MASVKDVIVAKIDAHKGMRGSTYRFARRLLDRAHDANGLTVLTYEQAAEICETDNHETIRGHLARLAALGLITYRRNAQVNVFWHDWAEAAALCQGDTRHTTPYAGDAPGLQGTSVPAAQARGWPPDPTCAPAYTNCSSTEQYEFLAGCEVLPHDTGCAPAYTNCAPVEQYEAMAGCEVLPHDTGCVPAYTNCVPVEQLEAEDDNELTEVCPGDTNRAPASTKRAAGAHPISKLSSKQASIDLRDQPACLLKEGGAGGGSDGGGRGAAAPGEEGGEGGGEDPPGTVPDDPVSEQEYAQAVMLLMDPRLVGVDEKTARRWAKGRSFELVRAHVFRWRREVAAGRDFSAGVIGRRLWERWDAPVTEAEKESMLWQLYQTESDLRSKYIPDEYSDIIMG
ncbi:MAG: hypothetical protein U0X20_21945 [Caldilineaceae bacterium]